MNIKTHNKKNIKAFTLIEMIVVIVIISILLVVGMQFGGNQINDLAEKTSTEYILDRFHNIHNKSISSNYYNGLKFDKVEIIFEEEKDDFDIKYFQGETSTGVQHISSQKPIYTIEELYDNKKDIRKAKIIIKPYDIACSVYKVDTEENTENLILKFKMKTGYSCFQLEQSICRLRKYDCKKID